MSAKDDLKRYQRDQDLLFQELEDRQRRSQQLITAQELADALAKVGARPEDFQRIERQLLKLGRLAGMSDAKAKQWATFLIDGAHRLRLKAGH